LRRRKIGQEPPRAGVARSWREPSDNVAKVLPGLGLHCGASSAKTVIDAERIRTTETKGQAVMELRKLITTFAALALLAGAGVAGAFAGSPAAGPATTTTTCTDQDQQGENEEADAATEVEQAATEVEQEAAREKADDESGDDQPGEQGDEQGENEDCD
jgi:hypothetical protein